MTHLSDSLLRHLREVVDLPDLTGTRYHQKDTSRGIKMTRTEEGERANRMVKQLELPKIGFSRNGDCERPGPGTTVNAWDSTLLSVIRHPRKRESTLPEIGPKLLCAIVLCGAIGNGRSPLSH